VLGWLGREAGEADFAGATSLSALSGKEKNKVVVQCGNCGEGMSTSGDRPLHGGLAQRSSCVAGRVAACAKAAPARPAATLDRGWRSSS